jgi:CRP-like cAMP-binding protein
MKKVSVTADTSAFTADPGLIRALETRSTPFKPSSDLVLFRQDDLPTGIFFVRKGTAVLTVHSSAKIVVQVVTGPSSILGLPGAICGSPYSSRPTFWMAQNWSSCLKKIYSI